MGFSAALIVALFLPILVNAEHGYPPASTSETGTCSQSSAEPTGIAPPATLTRNSANINVRDVLFVAHLR